MSVSDKGHTTVNITSYEISSYEDVIIDWCTNCGRYFKYSGTDGRRMHLIESKAPEHIKEKLCIETK